MFSAYNSMSSDSFDPKKINVEHALRMAKQIEATQNHPVTANCRVFRLQSTSQNVEHLNFLTFGCQGNGGASQKETADNIYNLIQNMRAEERPQFISILGDNVYDYGATSPDDPAFRKNFDDMYEKIHTTFNIPCFLVLGNHDYNFHKKGKLNPFYTNGINMAINQIAHTFLLNTAEIEEIVVAANNELPYAPETLIIVNIEEAIEKKFKRYQTTIENNAQPSEKPLIPILNVNKLPSWNMPYRYYSVYSEHEQMFFLDSNTYAKEYVAFLNGEIDPNVNQAAWFAQEAKNAKDAGRKILVSWHHPLFTPCKRHAHGDAKLYLTEAEQKILLATLKKSKDLPDLSEKNPDSYEAILQGILKQQGLLPCIFTAFNAHDHNISIVKDENLFQVTSGGGGGDNNNQKIFPPNIQFFYNKTGSVIVNFTDRGMELNICTTAGLSEKFCQLDNGYFMRLNPIETMADAEKIVNAIEKGCQQYLAHIASKKDTFLNLTWSIRRGNKGEERAEGILALIDAAKKEAKNSNYPISTLIEDVLQKLQTSGIDENSLRTYVNNNVACIDSTKNLALWALIVKRLESTIENAEEKILPFLKDLPSMRKNDNAQMPSASGENKKNKQKILSAEDEELAEKSEELVEESDPKKIAEKTIKDRLLTLSSKEFLADYLYFKTLYYLEGKTNTDISQSYIDYMKNLYAQNKKLLCFIAINYDLEQEIKKSYLDILNQFSCAEKSSNRENQSNEMLKKELIYILSTTAEDKLNKVLQNTNNEALNPVCYGLLMALTKEHRPELYLSSIPGGNNQYSNLRKNSHFASSHNDPLVTQPMNWQIGSKQN